jgi:hypothetical protein
MPNILPVLKIKLFGPTPHPNYIKPFIEMLYILPDSQFTIFRHSYFPGQQIAIGWSKILLVDTWFRLPLYNQHLYNGVVAARQSLISFALLYVDQLNFAILCSNIHQVILQYWAHKRTYHCVVLYYSLQKHCFD